MTRLTRPQTIKAIRKLREWERKNLPLYGTDAGYDLFLELAALDVNQGVSLKNLYLSLDYAESTIRLLFRNLEQDGWLELTKGNADGRHRTFHRTEKFDHKVMDWVNVIAALFSPKATPKN